MPRSADLLFQCATLLARVEHQCRHVARCPPATRPGPPHLRKLSEMRTGYRPHPHVGLLVKAAHGRGGGVERCRADQDAPVGERQRAAHRRRDRVALRLRGLKWIMRGSVSTALVRKLSNPRVTMSLLRTPRYRNSARARRLGHRATTPACTM